MTTAKRRMAVLVAASAAAGVLTLFAPATTSPAQAIPHDECVVIGTLSLSSGFYSPTVSSSAHSATFNFGGGLCLPSNTVPNATGTVRGWCGFNVGSGTSSNGDDFHWIGLNNTLFITGELLGEVSINPDPLIVNNTCANRTPGARHFLVNGNLIRQSCTMVNSPSMLMGNSASVATGDNSVHVHVGLFSIQAHIRTPTASVSASVFGNHHNLQAAVSLCA